MGVGVNATFRPLYLREKDPLAIAQEAGWAPGVGKVLPRYSLDGCRTFLRNLLCTKVHGVTRQRTVFLIL
jgi:hypothetical protein